MRTTLTFLMLTLSATAFAAPAVHDEGARVAVTLPGAHAAGQPEAHGDSIEVPLSGTVTPEKLTLEDATIKRVDVVGGAQPKLVIRMHHSRGTTQKLAAAAIVREANGELRVAMPRDASAALPVRQTPTSTSTSTATATATATTTAETPAAEAPKAATPKPATNVNANVDAKPALNANADAAKIVNEAKTAAPATEAKPSTKTAEAHAAATPADEAADLPAAAIAPRAHADAMSDALADAPKSKGLPLPYVIVALLCAVPLVVMARKKKKKDGSPLASLKVLASQSLGGRSRLVLVESEHQHILLAVNDQNTRVVARYDAADAVSPAAAVAAAVEAVDDGNEDADGDPETALEELPMPRPSTNFAKIAAAARIAADARAAADAAEARAAANPMRPRSTTQTGLRSVPQSPAVAGLLKLRGGNEAPAAATPVPASEGPSEWGEALRRAAAQRSKR